MEIKTKNLYGFIIAISVIFITLFFLFYIQKSLSLDTVEDIRKGLLEENAELNYVEDIDVLILAYRRIQMNPFIDTRFSNEVAQLSHNFARAEAAKEAQTVIIDSETSSIFNKQVIEQNNQSVFKKEKTLNNKEKEKDTNVPTITEQLSLKGTVAENVEPKIKVQDNENKERKKTVNTKDESLIETEIEKEKRELLNTLLNNVEKGKDDNSSDSAIQKTANAKEDKYSKNALKDNSKEINKKEIKENIALINNEEKGKYDESELKECEKGKVESVEKEVEQQNTTVTEEIKKTNKEKSKQEDAYVIEEIEKLYMEEINIIKLEDEEKYKQWLSKDFN